MGPGGSRNTSLSNKVAILLFHMNLHPFSADPHRVSNAQSERQDGNAQSNNGPHIRAIGSFLPTLTVLKPTFLAPIYSGEMLQVKDATI